MRELAAEKAEVWMHLEGLCAGAQIAQVFASDAVAEVAHPYGTLTGPAQIERFYEDLRRALPDATWRPEIFLGGNNHPDDRMDGLRVSPQVASMGHWQGTFTRPLLGIAPTGGVVHLRMSEVHHLNEAGQIARSWILPDFLDLMDQAGVNPLPPITGGRGMWPGPCHGFGVRMGATASAKGDESMARILDMHQALGVGADLSNIPMHHWHRNFMYYAGAGIGMSRGVAGFRMHHQAPFRAAFPDRHSKGHFVRIADGPLALTGGRLYATHSAPYLGVEATNRTVHIDVMDFYHFDEDGLILENWLPIDMLSLAHQLGLDLVPPL